MIVKHPPTIISIVQKATERRMMISPDEFDRFVANGLDFTSLSDPEQERYAAMAYKFDAGAVCFRSVCGCKVAYCKPWIAPGKDNGGAYYIPVCEKHRESEFSGLEHLCELQTLGAGINAFCFGRTDVPAGQKHALYYMAGLPHEDEIILDYFMSASKDPNIFSLENSRKYPGINAVAVYAVHAMQMIDTISYQRLKESRFANLLPFVSAGRVPVLDVIPLLEDYKLYMVRKEA